MMILGHYTPNYHGVMNDQFLDMYLLLIPFATLGCTHVREKRIVWRIDVLYKMANKYLNIDFGVATSVVGLFISAPAIFIYDPKTGVLSILGTYVTGIIIDHYVFGMTTKLRYAYYLRRTTRYASTLSMNFTVELLDMKHQVVLLETSLTR